MIEPTIRRAERDDFPAIVRMIQELAAHVDSNIAPKTTIEILEQQGPFGKQRFNLLVADSNGEITGFCLYTYAFSGWRGATGLFIEDLYVDKTARGLGLGKKLLAAAAAIERDNASFMKLEVKLTDPKAVRFYEKLGMKIFKGEGIMLLNEAEMSALAAP